MLARRGGARALIPQAEFDRVSASFVFPAAVQAHAPSGNGLPADARKPSYQFAAGSSATCAAHKVQGYKNVTLSLKRAGLPPAT
jgi:sulfite reductase (NADPH) hemoprotein beta-component